MAQHHFTFPYLSALKPSDKRREIFDTGEKGLAIRVNTSGKKTFFLRYRFGGRMKRITIGPFPAMELAVARRRARSLKVQINDGEDPQGDKYSKKYSQSNITVRQLAELFKKEHFPKLKDSTRRDYKSRIDKHIIPEFGNIALKDVQRGHIKQFLKKIAESRPIHANRIQAVFSKMFSYAVNEELTTNHPLKTLQKPGKEKRRDRFYEKQEIRALWDAFEQLNEPLQSLFKILLLTGQRIGEASRMRWKDIDTTQGTWVIPEVETKAGRTHAVPITEDVAEILESLHTLTGHNEYVFTSPLNEEMHIYYFRDVTTKIRTISEVSDFRPHDLRRTAATYMAELGTDRTTLGKILNHRGLSGDSHVTSIYDRHDYMKEKRSALNRWGSYLKQILKGKSETKIFKIG